MQDTYFMGKFVLTYDVDGIPYSLLPATTDADSGLRLQIKGEESGGLDVFLAYELGYAYAVAFQSAVSGGWVTFKTGAAKPRHGKTVTCEVAQLTGQGTQFDISHFTLTEDREINSGALLWWEPDGVGNIQVLLQVKASKGGALDGAYFVGIWDDDAEKTHFTADQKAISLLHVQRYGSAVGQDLSRADLSGSRLANVDFTEANLKNAVLDGASMTTAYFARGNVSSASFKNTDLAGAKFISADLTGAIFDNATLGGAYFESVVLRDATFSGTSLSDVTFNSPADSLTQYGGVDFSHADLTQAKFVGHGLNPTPGNPVKLGYAKVPFSLIEHDWSNLDLTMADIIGLPKDGQGAVQLDNLVAVNCVLTGVQLPRASLAGADFTGADLSQANLTRAVLTHCKLDEARLVAADLSYADLTSATLTGGVAMFGANLSNAIVTGANMAGAQMGSIKELFRVTDGASGEPGYDAYLAALRDGDAGGVHSVFDANGATPSDQLAVVAAAGSPDRAWTVVDGGITHTVRLTQDAQGASTLVTYEATAAAVLVNAFMRDVDLRSANLYGVNASGVQLYGQYGGQGGARLDDKAILDGARFDGANLSLLSLKHAAADGAGFSHATLVGAELDGARLGPGPGGAAASFANANLQGASFAGAHLDDAIFTDAAVALGASDGTTDGVWLFSSAGQSTAKAQLTAATKQFALDASLASKLTQGPVKPCVRAAFAAHDVSVPPDATIAMLKEGSLWTVADGPRTYWVFHSVDATEDVPALGVSTTPDLQTAFAIPLNLESDLVGGRVVSAAVRAAFAAAGHAVAATAMVTRTSMPTDWSLAYSGATGFDLWLGLTLDLSLAITVRPSMPAVQSLFASYSLELARATVTSPATGTWSVDNDSDNPFNPAKGYVKFNVRAVASDEVDVYGSELRVEHVGPHGAVLANFPVLSTGLTKDQLAGSTICPNSASASDNAGLPFATWMRASTPPKPPFCVPSTDGAYYCPPPSTTETP